MSDAVDTPASHLRNALQVSILLASAIGNMIPDPVDLDYAGRSLRSIDKRIYAALSELERK